MEGGAVTFKTTRQFWTRLNSLVISFSNCTQAFILLIWSRKPFTQKVTALLFLIVPNWKQPSWFFHRWKNQQPTVLPHKGKTLSDEKEPIYKATERRGDPYMRVVKWKKPVGSMFSSSAVMLWKRRSCGVSEQGLCGQGRGRKGLSRHSSWILRSRSYFVWGCNGAGMHHTFAKIHWTSKHSEWALTHAHVNYHLGWFYDWI